MNISQEEFEELTSVFKEQGRKQFEAWKRGYQEGLMDASEPEKDALYLTRLEELLKSDGI